jgi:hypothetical protein
MIRKLRTTAVTLGLWLLVIAAPVTGASAAAATTAPATTTIVPASSALTFVPPRVGPICVAIGEIILGGNMVSPGLNVCTPGASLPTIQG